MIKEKRQKDLIALLKSNEVMTVSELANKLNASMMTIRRDLEYLEQSNLIKKVHGGAILLKEDIYQPSFKQRVYEFDAQKDSIGKTAASLINEGNVVFFDAGTTPLATIKHIPDNVSFTALTTGLMTAVALCNKPNVEVINIGGYVHHSSYSSTNQLAVDTIRRFNADIAFISTKAFMFPQGTFEALIPLVEIKQAIVAVSNKIVLLADHSKFNSTALCQSIPFNQIDSIITDSNLSEEMVKQVKTAGKEIIVAE